MRAHVPAFTPRTQTEATVEQTVTKKPAKGIPLEQLSPESQLATGVTDGYVRLSVGIEHIDDILADLDRALERSRTGTAALDRAA